MNIKEKFENSTKKDIVLLYLITIMICIMLYLFSKDLFINMFSNKSHLTLMKKNTTAIIIKSTKLSDLELITYFNTNVKLFQLFLYEMKIAQSTSDIKIKGTYQNIVNFLMKVSRNLQIKQLDMQKINNDIVVSLKFERDKFFIAQSKYVVNKTFLNPFFLEKLIQVNKPSNIIISAIVDFEILVDNEWYQKGDMIEEYKVLEIRKSDVLLLNKNNKQVIKSINYE